MDEFFKEDTENKKEGTQKRKLFQNKKANIALIVAGAIIIILIIIGSIMAYT
jgi:hypothetical protein